MFSKIILASAALADAAVAAPTSGYEKPSYPAPASNSYQQPSLRTTPTLSPPTTPSISRGRTTPPRLTLLPTATPTPAIRPRPTSSPLGAPLVSVDLCHLHITVDPIIGCLTPPLSLPPPSVIQFASIACTAGKTPEDAQRALYQCYALESQAKLTNPPHHAGVARGQGECYGVFGTTKVGAKPSSKLASFRPLAEHFHRSMGSRLELTGKEARYRCTYYMKKFGRTKLFEQGTGAGVEDPDRYGGVNSRAAKLQAICPWYSRMDVPLGGRANVTPLYHVDSSAERACEVPADGEDEFASEEEADSDVKEEKEDEQQ
ncbi:hypothetical protein BDK51DRAFT_39901 [Blyttiomyces helicus]|uniref:Uncharacterized protein n=1 Tax=Blyttiomyces helicus TaxID=388810 RepID=A0A4P9W8Z8_9FUNG|nr:hypothetical protein BDK51DRAFT_39901 [Blyttiomyces helicus]|eukprot:RKO88854.1 hypothetical protein BDK51DRAFT_39901 [Blyttiomyces helicus]